MLENWIVVYSSDQLYDAEIIKSILTDNDIECVLMNKKDSTYGFGEIEVCVTTTKAFEAKQLILEFKGE